MELFLISQMVYYTVEFSNKMKDSELLPRDFSSSVTHNRLCKLSTFQNQDIKEMDLEDYQTWTVVNHF